MNDLHESAIRYLRLGWTVTPIRPREKKPALPNWPVVSRRFSEANLDLIWSGNPEANVGLLTGVNFDVLDIDGEDGQRSLDRLFSPESYTHPGPIARTGGGGFHLYFQPTGNGNRAQMLTKVDYRGIGGQVIAPPSIHPNGMAYRWLVGHGPETRLPEAPDWLLALLRQTAASQPVARDPSRTHDHGDVVAAFIEKGHTLHRDGPKRYKARCYTGLHGDTEPSLTIYTATNSWYCHGCQSSGDAGNVKDGSYVRQGRRATVS
jgi:hypothetical protein